MVGLYDSIIDQSDGEKVNKSFCMVLAVLGHRTNYKEKRGSRLSMHFRWRSLGGGVNLCSRKSDDANKKRIRNDFVNE